MLVKGATTICETGICETYVDISCSVSRVLRHSHVHVTAVVSQDRDDI